MVIKAEETKKHFYTRMEDIEKELYYYEDYFKNQIILLNCNDMASNFYVYFKNNFSNFGIKKIIATSYKENEEKAKKIELEIINGELTETINDLDFNGSFRNDEGKKLISESDIVITHPPHTAQIFNDFMDAMVNYNKKFLIINTLFLPIHKNNFKYFKENKMWLGHNKNMTKFLDDKGNIIPPPGAVGWITNFGNRSLNVGIDLIKSYENNIQDYPRYENYNAINIDKVNDIPYDYYGIMGVPISYISKHDHTQFKLIGVSENNDMPKINKKNLWKIGGGVKKTGQKPYYKPFDKQRHKVNCQDSEGNQFVRTSLRIFINYKKKIKIKI